MATIHHLSGLRGANLERFRRASDLIEANMRRETCPYCSGVGKFLGVVDGQWREQKCAQCAGNGSTLGESA